MVQRRMRPLAKRTGRPWALGRQESTKCRKSFCCASMIMSPFVLDRNVPLIGPPKGGQIGADRNEQRGVRKSGSAGAGAEQAAAAGGGCGGTEARQRGAIVESRSRCEVPKEGAAAGAGEVRWAGGRAFRTDAGGGTLGVGGWAEGGCRNAATLDAGGRAVESRAEAPAASSSTR